MRKSDQLIGITLAFGARENGELLLYEDSFLLRANTAKSTLAAANKIGKERSFGRLGSKEDFQLCLGIVKAFRVVGPLGQGAMLGQTSKFGYKSLGKVQKLVRKERQYAAFMSDCAPSKDGFYIAKLLYFLGPPVPYNDRRALTCLCVIESDSAKGLMKKAEIAARSSEFKGKLCLEGDEGIISPSLLEFVGVLDVVPIFERLKEENIFVGTVKKLRSTKEIESFSPSYSGEDIKEFFKKKYYQ